MPISLTNHNGHVREAVPQQSCNNTNPALRQFSGSLLISRFCVDLKFDQLAVLTVSTTAQGRNQRLTQSRKIVTEQSLTICKIDVEPLLLIRLRGINICEINTEP